MPAQLSMDDHRRELDAAKAELQACRERLESALSEVQEKTEHVDVMVSYFNDVVDGQMKPQLQEAVTTASQLRGQVATLSNDLASVKSQLTQKTKESEHLTRELEAAKGEVSARNTATLLLEDQVATLKTALQEKSRADDNKMEWFWVCIVSLMVAIVAHAWNLLVAVMSWTWMLAMSACWKVKTWTKAVLASDKATDKNDQDVKREQWSVGRMSVVGLLLVGVGVLVFFGVTTIATKDDTWTHPLHDVTSGPLRWMPSGLAGDAIPMVVVDGPSSEPLFADTTVFSPVDDGDETQDDDPEENEPVGRAFGVATTTAGCVLKVWVGWALVSSLVQLYAGCRSP